MSLQHHSFRYLVFGFVLLAMASPAAAADGDRVGPSFFAGVQAGGMFHSPFGELGNAPQLRLEGGATLFRQLDVGLALSWDRAARDVRTEDARLAAGSADWEISTTLVKVALPARWHFLPQGPWDVMAGAGPQFSWVRTSASGSSGESALPQNTQEEGRVGVLLSLVGGRQLGPGFASLEISMEIGTVNGSITGSASTSGLGLLLGYRMRF